MGDDPLLDRLSALLAQARREGYERGYADAVRRIVAAASADQGGGEPGVAPAPARPPAARGPAPREGGTERPRRQRAKRGSLESRLLEILAGAPEGATIAEIEAAGASDDEPLKVPSIRVALQRLLSSGRVGREGRRWQIADGAPADDPGDDGAAGASGTEPVSGEDDHPPS